MGFLNGSVTFTRFKTGNELLEKDPEKILSLLKENKQMGDAFFRGSSYFTAGNSIRDHGWDLAKNFAEDAMVFALRINKNSPPAELLRAYYEEDVAAAAKGNPSGFASKNQKKEAKEGARDRIEEEGKDGRWIKHKLVPVLWDLRSGFVYLGSTTPGHISMFLDQFDSTFAIRPLEINAARLARILATDHQFPLETSGVELKPTAFHLAESREAIDWITEGIGFLGNEFFFWLWFLSITPRGLGDDKFTLCDGSAFSGWLTKTITWDCPVKEKGRDVLTGEGCARLPESVNAANTGKLPRKAGFGFVHNNVQFDFCWNAESFGVSGVKFPKSEETDTGARKAERVQTLRDFVVMIELLYATFLEVRLDGPKWYDFTHRVKKFLNPEFSVTVE